MTNDTPPESPHAPDVNTAMRAVLIEAQKLLPDRGLVLMVAENSEAGARVSQMSNLTSEDMENVVRSAADGWAADRDGGA